VRLPEAASALAVELLFTMTVMDNSIKSSADVKYPTEKKVARAALA
jgi:hypothetical protein